MFKKPVIIVSHTDKDGVGSIAVAGGIFDRLGGDFKYHCVENNRVNEKIVSIVEENEGQEYLLFICDHSPSKVTYDLLVAQGVDFHVFDHHKSSEVLEIVDPRLHIVLNTCGTKLFWQWCKDYATITAQEPALRILNQYEEFVFHVNDYDMWIHESPHSKRLNELLYKVGRGRFIKRFIENPDPHFTKDEELIVTIAEKEREAYINRAEKSMVLHTDQYGHSYGHLFAESNQSELGNELLIRHEDMQYVFMINAQANKVSIRGKGNVDVSAIAKHFAGILETSGGGHHDAAGFSYPPIDLPKIYYLLTTY